MELEICDMNTSEGCAKMEAYMREEAEKVKGGQQIYAKIKRTSKHFGQGEAGMLFPVYIMAGYKDS